MSTALIPRLVTEPLVVNDYMAQWLLEYGPATREAYARDLREFLGFCRDYEIDPLQATRAVLAAWSRDLAENGGYSPATVARRLAAVSSFYGWLAAEGVVQSSPAVNVRRPKIEQESTSLGLSRDESRDLLMAAAAENRQMEALAKLLLLTGMRISEALGLRGTDFGTERGHIFCTITRKGGKRQRIPLPWDAWELIEPLVDASEGSYVFRGAHGGPLPRTSAWRQIKRLSEKAGVPAIGPHSLRHTFVTLCLEAGVPLHEVQDAAGHADPRTTQRYNHARMRMTNAPSHRLAGFLDA